MQIAQISDTHILAKDSSHESADLREDCLRACIDHINQQGPDAVIFTGDATQHGSVEEYQRLDAVLVDLVAPLYVVPGNRDDKKTMQACLNKAHFPAGTGPEFLHYVIDEHEVRLVGIDSTLSGERKGVFCASRQTWLESVLSEQSDKPSMLFIHHPPFDVGDHYIDGYRNREDAKALKDIVARHRHIAGFICGHVHHPLQQDWAGTAARIMPSVAVDLRKGVDETRLQHQPAYMMHSVTSGDDLNTRMVVASR